MSVKPILFNTEMVQAILDGRKTQTRRVIKPQPVKEGVFWRLGHAGWSMDDRVTPVYGHSLYNRMPYKPDDVLWVRETWSEVSHSFVDEILLVQTAVFHKYKTDFYDEMVPWKWKPSIHMPKEVARIFLKVTGVRLERLQAICYPDVYAEGINEEYGSLTDFVELWDSINDKRGFGWESNPWVWVIEFERCGKPKEW